MFELLAQTPVAHYATANMLPSWVFWGPILLLVASCLGDDIVEE